MKNSKPGCKCWIKMCGPGESPIKFLSGLWNWESKRKGDIYYNKRDKKHYWQVWWAFCHHCGKPAKEVK